MKYNCVQKTCQKAFRTVLLYPGQRIQVKVRVCGSLVPVELKYDYGPGRESYDTLEDYWHKVLALREDVLETLRILHLASEQERTINWRAHRRIIELHRTYHFSLDFFREAFVYGVRLTRVFEPWHPLDYTYMSIFNRLISRGERRLYCLTTFSHQYVVRFEDH